MKIINIYSQNGIDRCLKGLILTLVSHFCFRIIVYVFRIKWT